MKRIFLIAAIACILGAERPTVNVPLADRCPNWSKGGSCVHATIVSLFRWQGRYAMAGYWRAKYSGGEYWNTFQAKLDRDGIRYAQTTTGDVRFLEWACRTRRGCGIQIHGSRDGYHFVALVYLDDKYAAILDNNHVSTYKWYKRDDLIREWKSAKGGWAVALVYTPAAPLPE